jgi:hypothetical protein
MIFYIKDKVIRLYTILCSNTGHDQYEVIIAKVIHLRGFAEKALFHALNQPTYK